MATKKAKNVTESPPAASRPKPSWHDQNPAGTGPRDRGSVTFGPGQGLPLSRRYPLGGIRSGSRGALPQPYRLYQNLNPWTFGDRVQVSETGLILSRRGNGSRQAGTVFLSRIVRRVYLSRIVRRVYETGALVGSH